MTSLPPPYRGDLMQIDFAWRSFDLQTWKATETAEERNLPEDPSRSMCFAVTCGYWNQQQPAYHGAVCCIQCTTNASAWHGEGSVMPAEAFAAHFSGGQLTGG